MVYFIIKKCFLQVYLLNYIISITIANDTICTHQMSKNTSSSTQASVIVSLLDNAKIILEDAKKYATLKASCTPQEPLCDKPMDCAAILEANGSAKSGIHRIWPLNRVIDGSVKVNCDMDDDGGAWTVIQRRGDFDSGKDYFYKNWEAYKTGFGDLHKDFWLGNDKIFAITNQRSNMAKFILSDWEGNTTYATYDEFWIEGETRKYTMHVSGYRGNAGDSFSGGTNGVPFTTNDQDNDTHENNCAILFKGAWWYTSCHASNLNGMYLKGAHESHADGVEWHGFRGHYYSLKDTVIKIRPNNFEKKLPAVRPH